MDIRMGPGKLKGTVRAMPSKSHGHRLMIAAYLSGEKIPPWNFSRDIQATAECLGALGRPEPVLDCCESGSTLRFMVPVTMALKNRASFWGRGRLPERPMAPLTNEMKKHGCTFYSDSTPCHGSDTLPHPDSTKLFDVTGPMSGGSFFLPGNVSSQFFTGLLFALPLTREGGTIEAEGPLESVSYIDMTLKVLADFGISVNAGRDEKKGNMFYEIKGGQTYIYPGNLTIEGDWSNGAFWETAAALGSPVICRGLDTDSVQGDKAVRVCLASMRTEDTEINISQTPDLLPIMAVAASAMPGKTLFTGCARLRIKESDRLSSTAALINSLGGHATEGEDFLEVRGRASVCAEDPAHPLKGGVVSSCNDHRLVMAAALASTISAGPVTITGAEAVEKSWPGFFREFTEAGGRISIIEQTTGQK